MKSMSNRGQDRQSHREVVGIIPAGGEATRLSPLPCSKELLPIGFRDIDKGSSFRPKVISHYLLETMRFADIKKAYIVIREGKWDIPAYYGDGTMLDMNLAYLIMDLPYGVPYTLDQAFPFVKDAIVALGFPDMIFRPENAFAQVLARQEESGADIVLGLFPALRPHKTDMVKLDEQGRVQSIEIKPDETTLTYAWEIAVWTPHFSRFMHDYLLSRKEPIRENRKESDITEKTEMHISEIVQAAIERNLQVDTVIFKDGTCLDVGTPRDLIKAVQNAYKDLGEFSR
jgi:glucose-1-phosphate thymidylyltransferase